MVKTTNDKDFDVRASVIVYKDGKQCEKFKMENPVFLTVNKGNFIAIRATPSVSEDYKYLTTTYNVDSLTMNLIHFEQIVKYGSLNPDKCSEYKYALEYFGLTNIKDLLTIYQDGSKWLNLIIEIKSVTEDKTTLSRKAKAKQLLTTFRFRVVDSRPDDVDAKPITDWITIDSCGSHADDDVDSVNEVKDIKTKVNTESNVHEAMSKLTSLLADVYSLPSTESITLSIKIDKSK